MEVIDYLRSAALVVSFLATAFVGRRTWLHAQAIAMAVFGAGFLFFPKVVYGYQVTGNLDYVQTWIMQTMGLCFLAFAVILYLSQNSRDDSVQTALLMSSTLGSFLMLQTMVMDHYYGPAKGRFNEKHQYFGMLGCLLLLVGNMVNLARGGLIESRHTSTSNRLARHLLVVLVLHTLVHFYRFGFPEHALSFVVVKDFKVDPLHLHLVRIMGSWGLGWVLYIFMAQAFHDDLDKHNVFLLDILVLTVALPLQAYYQYAKMTVTPGQMAFGAVFSVLYFGHSVFGYAGDTPLLKFKRR